MLFIDVYELRLRTSLRNGFGGGDEGIRHREYAIPRADPCSHECETQRIGPTAHTNTMINLAELCKRSFKILYRFASYESSGMKCSSKNGD